MRNNRFTKVITWIIAAVMIWAFAASAVADEGPTNSDPTSKLTIGGAATLNDICKPTELLEGDTLTLTVDNGYDALPASFIYNLPDRVESAENGGNSMLNWTYNNGKMTFTWNVAPSNMFTADIKVTLVAGTYDLYNMAVVKLNGKDTWYRLGKSSVEIEVPSKQYKAGMNYTATAYDFSDTVFTYNGIPYYYTEDATNVTRPSFTAVEFEFAKADKIGGLDGDNPRWLLGTSKSAYGEDNGTAGYHRNYRLTLISGPIEQPLYNFLNIGGSYYRLKKTTVVANPVRDYRSGTDVTDYTLPNGDYNFKNLLLEYKGELYRYSDHELTGDFESYYTIDVEVEMKVKDRMHSKADWYSNESAWLDGSKETFTEEELSKGNNLWGYHRDYKPTFHKGKPVTIVEEPAEAEKSVTITSDWPEGKPAFIGTKITMTAYPEGFNDDCTFQWQRKKDQGEWENIDGANAITYSYVMDENMAQYIWRVVVTDTE